jgi:hypothetical protein
MDKLQQILKEMILASKTERDQLIYWNKNKKRIEKILIEVKEEINVTEQI